MQIEPDARAPLDQATVDMVRSTLGFLNCTILGLSRIDLSYGQATTGPSEKCIWLDNGHRVTIAIAEGGGYIASVSKEPDPEALKL